MQNSGFAEALGGKTFLQMVKDEERSLAAPRETAAKTEAGRWLACQPGPLALICLDEERCQAMMMVELWELWEARLECHTKFFQGRNGWFLRRKQMNRR